MKIHDISQEVFSCKVFPGDRAPERFEDRRTARGDLYNLTSFSMCAHNGTHIDAPFHFLNDGDTVDRIPLGKTVGYCFVVSKTGDILKQTAEEIIKTAGDKNADSAKRILIKGKATVTEEAARVFADNGIYLLGVESQTVGPEDAPMAVHKILLHSKTVLLEGVCLEGINDGVYLLNAAPLKLEGSDGSPCRAILIEE